MAKRTVTDLDAVKIVAKALLYTEIHPTKFFPMIVQHPFTNTGVVGINKDGQMLCLSIAENKEDLAEWQRQMDKKIDEAKDVYRIYIHLNKAYALTFVDMAEPHLSEQDFAGLLQDAWMRSENPNDDCNVSKSRLVGLFAKATQGYLMTESDREVYDALEDKVTVYRGVTQYNQTNIKALSWTLDYEVAQWFAERFDEDGTVYKAEIDKKHILAFFGGRNESEVIVDPKYLTDITAIESMEDNSFDMTL